MRTVNRMAALLLGVAGITAADTPGGPTDWKIPIQVKTLPNGLTVVVSEEHASPTFGLSLVYKIGMRLEPKGRTGFAHLFEHMMFEGTPKAPKGVFDRVIEGGGGTNNGFTRTDTTTYIESAPISALEPILWLEADRMTTLDFSETNLKNQRDVVKEEIRVNVKNRPYGVFFWTDLNAKAFDKWENAHDGYGSFEDLDAAALADVESFFKAYYAPNNAVLAIVGDVDPKHTFELVEKYFAAVPSRPATPAPDLSEPLNTAERTLSQSDPLAQVPAVAIGWKMPPRAHADSLPAAVLAAVLTGSEASRLYQALVKGKELLLNMNGGLNWPLGSYRDYDGPVLLTLYGVYKPSTDAKTVVAAVDEEIQKIAHSGVPAEELARVKTQMLSDLYSNLEDPLRRATALATRQAFTGNAATLLEIPTQIEAVSAADLQRVATTYLTAANRTVIDRRPAPPSGATSATPGAKGGADR
jgi:zinc protease